MSQPAAKRRYQVLLADHQPGVMERIQTELTRRGIDVKATNSGRDALEYLRRHPVHLVIASETLDDVPGRKLFEEARTLPNGKALPFVFLSSSQALKTWARETIDHPPVLWSRSLTSQQLLTKIRALFHTGSAPEKTGKAITARLKVRHPEEPSEAHEAAAVSRKLNETIRDLKSGLSDTKLSAEGHKELRALQPLVAEVQTTLKTGRITTAHETIQLINSAIADILVEHRTHSGNDREQSQHFDAKEHIGRRKSMSKIEQLVESISSIGGITKLVIASKDGTLLSKQGVKGDQFGSFITFIAISAEHVKGTMGFTQLHHIILNRETGEKILILTGPKVIAGIELGSTVSPVAVVDSLKPIINRVTV